MDLNIVSILPEIILSLTGTILMMLIPRSEKGDQSGLAYLALAGILFALAAAVYQWNDSGLAFGNMVFQDRFGHLARILFLAVAGSITLTSVRYLKREGILHGEFFCLLLFATVGMCFMATSADLIMTFIGLETLSIATYVLAGFKVSDHKSSEAAWKYFLLGAFSTAIMLYGIAFVYGSVGSTHYPQVADAIAQGSFPTTLLLGVGLILVGFGFKVAMAPFHVWAPDVYQGSPFPVTMHLAVGSKAAAFVALLRIFQQMTPALGEYWTAAFWTGAILTMVIGNVAAIAQTNLKRLLAYSSVAHAGYLLVGMAANSEFGAQGILFYLVAYAFMTVGALTVLQTLSREGEKGIDIDDFKGIGARAPFLSMSLTVFLISMAGIPTTAGFMAKFFLFSAAIEKQLYWLVVIAVITSAMALYYYLRVIVCMYMKEGDAASSFSTPPLAVRLVIGLMLAGTIFFGIFPSTLLDLANQAVKF